MSNLKLHTPTSSPSLVVAASNAHKRSIASSHLRCQIGHDDSLTIMNAIDFLDSTIGGKVILSEGTFTCSSSISIPSTVVLEGAGPSTTLKIADNSAITLLTNSDTTNGNTDIHIRNLTIDGNKANQSDTTTDRYGIQLVKVSRGSIQNVDVHDCETSNNEGIRVSGGGDSSLSRSFFIDNVRTYNNDYDGIRIMFAQRSVHISNLSAYDNGHDGVYIDHSEGKYINVDAYSNTGNGIYIRNVSSDSLIGLSATENGEHGILVEALVDSQGAVWEARNNSTASSGTSDDIFFDENSALSHGRTANLVVMGVAVGAAGSDATIFGAATEGYGINFESPASGVYSNIGLYGVRIGGTVTGEVNIRAVSNGDNIIIQDHPGATDNFRLRRGNFAVFSSASVHTFGGSEIQDFTYERTNTAVDANSAAEAIIGVTDTSIARTITLLTADADNGRVITVKDESGAAGTNNITIATEGSETIDGAATSVISTNYGSVTVYSDGTNWFVI